MTKKYIGKWLLTAKGQKWFVTYNKKKIGDVDGIGIGLIIMDFLKNNAENLEKIFTDKKTQNKPKKKCFVIKNTAIKSNY